MDELTKAEGERNRRVTRTERGGPPTQISAFQGEGFNSFVAYEISLGNNKQRPWARKEWKISEYFEYSIVS